MRRLFRNSIDPTKTWDGWRWFFVLLALVFASIAVWLALHEGLIPLTLIPLGFSLLSLLVALLASDQRIRRITFFLQAFS